MDAQPLNQQGQEMVEPIFLISLTAIALYFCYIIAQPFPTSIAWALIIAIPFHPIDDRLHRIIRNPSAAALVSVLIVILIAIVHAMLLGPATVSEPRNAFQSHSEKSAAEGGWTPYLTRIADAASHWIGEHVQAPDF